LAPISSGESSSQSVGVAPVQHTCEITAPNGETPPGERPSPGHHGNGALWTALWSDGTVIFRRGGLLRRIFWLGALRAGGHAAGADFGAQGADNLGETTRKSAG
jgi:hypothetical protein